MAWRVTLRHLLWLAICILCGCDQGSIDGNTAGSVAERTGGTYMETYPCAQEFALNVSCAKLWVSSLAGKQGEPVALPVRILRYQGSDKEAAPLIYLQGGPGSRLDLSAESMEQWQAFADYAGLKRDLIVYNRRGSQLQCPDYERWYQHSLLERPDRSGAQTRADKALVRCINQLEGWPEVGLSTQSHAADLRSLVRALELKKWHLLGVSYGSRLAISMAADTGVESLILDSVYPPEVGGALQLPQLLGGALEGFSLACKSNKSCSVEWARRFGQEPLSQRVFVEKLSQALGELDAKPIPIEVVVGDWPETIWVSAPRFLSAAFAATYSPYRWQSLIEAISILLPPESVTLSEQGRQSGEKALQKLIQLSLGQVSSTHSATAYNAIDCMDNRLGDAAEYERSVAQHPWLNPYLSGLWEAQPCHQWREHLRPLVWPEATSPPKTVVLAGRFDPITPPGWAELVTSKWPEARIEIFEDAGHSILIHRPCALAQLEDFMRGAQSTIAACNGDSNAL